ncbi:hypothetical protein Leryth_022945 [Lithospermum erythrorhizon]|nr:hypothetical protein Leryth_022945 [Lithospermum erythrorhizon]
MNVVEYDGKSLLGFSLNKSSDASRNDFGIVSQNHSNTYDHQLNHPSLPAPIRTEQPSSSPGLAIGGYVNNMSSRYLMQPESMNLNATTQLDNPSFPTNHQLINSLAQAQSSKNDELLALGPTQPSMPSFHAGGSSNPTTFRGYEEYFTEEEIRLRSHEMLENDDMQHLLRIFNMNGHSNLTNSSYPYTSVYTPNAATNFVYNEEQTRSSGKAVVGWLKLKAALRWGIFIRKKAAERRAQIVELDDS